MSIIRTAAAHCDFAGCSQVFVLRPDGTQPYHELMDAHWGVNLGDEAKTYCPTHWKCCCQMGGAVGKRHGIPSGEGPEFDCADCPIHGGQQTKYRCKRHERESLA